MGKGDTQMDREKDCARLTKRQRKQVAQNIGLVVVDLRHRSHRLGALTLAVLAMLDGTRVRGQLCEAIRRRMAEGGLKLPPAQAAGQRAIDVSRAVEDVLDSLARLCLLEGE